MSKKSIFSR